MAIVDAHGARSAPTSFFLTVSAVFALTLFIGFAQSFFLAPLFDAPPLATLHVAHGVAGTGWIIMLVWQSRLISQRDFNRHRQNGIMAMALAIVICGTSAWIIGQDFADPAPPTNGMTDAAVLLIRSTTMIWFALFVVLGLRFRHSGAAHKRYMILATIAMMAPATTRIARLFRQPGVPPILLNGAFLASLFILLLIWYDWRTLRRIHPVTLWGGLAYTLWALVRIPIATSDEWARFVARLAFAG